MKIKFREDFIGKEIKRIELTDYVLSILFEDNSVINIIDTAQECCEERYISCDDDIKLIEGEKIKSIELKGCEDIGDYSEAHEIQFFQICTDKDSITFAAHNVHNGYHRGFRIDVYYIDK